MGRLQRPAPGTRRGRFGRGPGLRALALAAAALAALMLAVGVGSVPVSPADIARVLAHRLLGTPLPADFSPILEGLVLNIRLPRAALAFGVGAAAAVGGTVMQSVLKNPLASPYGLGVSSGAGLAAALMIVSGLAGGALGSLALPAAALAGGLAAAGAAMALAGRLDRGLSNNTIILTGMVLSLFLNALMSTLSAANPEYSQRILLWQLGSFSGRGWDAAAIVWAVTAVCTAAFWAMGRALDVMTFGEEQALSMGLELRRTKAVLIVLVAALTGTAVAFAGVIGFVDLIAPHVVRRFFGARHRVVLPMAALLGGGFMALCDLAGRTLASPSEIPVGSITALIGAPFFIYVYFAGRKRG